jgi:hypothetical protein
MAETSAGVATRSVAAAPRTVRRSAEWPTMKPVLIAIRPSRAARKSPVVRQSNATPTTSERDAFDPASGRWR